MRPLVGPQEMAVLVHLEHGADHEFGDRNAVYPGTILPDDSVLVKVFDRQLVIPRRGRVNIFQIWKTLHRIVAEELETDDRVDI